MSLPTTTALGGRAARSGPRRFKSGAKAVCLFALDNLPVPLLVGLMELSRIRLSLASLAAAAAVLPVVLRSFGEKLGLLDWSVLLFLASAAVSTCFALYKPAAIMQLALCVCVSLLYFAIRAYRGNLLLLLSTLALIATIYCARGFDYFIRSYRIWRGLEFGRLVDFRAYVTLTPRGLRPGNPDAVYLAFLATCLVGFVLAARSGWRAKLALFLAPAILSIVSIALSFSRGMYLATFAGVVILLLVLPRRGRRLLVAGLLVAVLLVMAMARHYPIAAAVADTATMNATESQRLSMHGRSAYDLSGLRLAEKSPWVGVGPGNFALGIHAFSLHRDATVVTEPFSLVIGVAAKQGLFGLLALILLAAAELRAVIRGVAAPDREVFLALGAGFAMLLVYGLTQSFLLSSPSVAAASYAWFGILGRIDANATR